MRSKFIKPLFAAMCISILGTVAFSQNKGKEMRAAEERVDNASKIIAEIMRVSDNAIPVDLLEKAKAIVVFPGALKLGLGIGGQFGSGVAIRRLDDGWSAPAFLKMKGGSIGPQIGGEKTDYVLLVMNDNGLKSLLADKFEMGGEGSVVAGPVGRTASATTSATFDSQILSYSRSKGLFAGLSLKGVVITQDEDMNQAIYQKSARQVLGDSPVGWKDAPESLQVFSKTVYTYAK